VISAPSSPAIAITANAATNNPKAIRRASWFSTRSAR
jgi:hypothetical protein